MAPKKGGSSSSGIYGSGSSGGSSCGNCNEPLKLFGYNWKDPTTNASFAIEIIVIIVLFACVAFALRFKWARQYGTDRLRTAGYVFAAVSSIIYEIITVVDVGLREADTETTYLYYLVYIFISLFWRLSELIILAVILRTISESGKLRGMNPANIVAILVLAALSAAVFGMYIAYIVDLLRNGPHSRYYYYDSSVTLEAARWHVSVAYQALYLVISILAMFVGVFAMAKERSKQMLIMVALVLPALFLRSLMVLVYYAVYDAQEYGHNTAAIHINTLQNIGWADSFIYDLMTAAIFIGVAIVGCLTPRNEGVLQQKGHANTAEHSIVYEG